MRSQPELLLCRPHLLCCSADPPCASGRCSSSVALSTGPRANGRCTSSDVPPTRLALAAGAPPLPPCRPAPCHRPEFSSFCCRPSFSPPVHPRRRRYTRVAAGTPASPTGPRANGRCSSSARSSSARTSSAVPLTRPVPAAGAPPPPPAPPPRRRMALFLPKCPVAKCQSAVPRRDPAILLTIWQRSPIGTTFVCFMASPVKEPAGKMKTNN